MTVPKIVVALGGNALLKKGDPATAEAQLEVVKKTVKYLAEMSCRDNELAIVHGNGPQIGNIVLASEAAAHVVPVMPFDVCGAMSQGYIGYHIQQALRHALIKRNRHVPVVTIITQVVVDKDDPAFKNPTKPIGPFYSEEEAQKIEQEKGYHLVEDAGRGWRRVVASPMPQKIVEFSCLKELWDTTIVITAGGGGIPVIENKDGSLEGIAAVIDKDLAAARLANDIEADVLMILTEVEKVALNFNKPDQKDLDSITVEEAEKYMAEGHFAPGSMLPKMQAAVMFVKENPGKKAIITSLFKSLDEVIKQSDFLSLHLPYSAEVHHLINKERLEMMKPDAYLINTARGAHIDEKSLVKHLREGKIAGAALDVYEREPLPAPGLVDLDNVTLLPHLGSATTNTRNAMATMAAESVCALLTERIPDNLLNPEIFS